MFDIGFWELCLIAVVALLILGPERLPVAARTAGLWIGKARRMIGNVKSEIDRELQLDEVRRRLKEEESKLRETTGIDDLENLSENTIADVESFQNNINTDLDFADSDKTTELNKNTEKTSSQEADTAEPTDSDYSRNCLFPVNLCVSLPTESLSPLSVGQYQ